MKRFAIIPVVVILMMFMWMFTNRNVPGEYAAVALMMVVFIILFLTHAGPRK